MSKALRRILRRTKRADYDKVKVVMLMPSTYPVERKRVAVRKADRESRKHREARKLAVELGEARDDDFVPKVVIERRHKVKNGKVVGYEIGGVERLPPTGYTPKTLSERGWGKDAE